MKKIETVRTLDVYFPTVISDIVLSYLITPAVIEI